MQASLCRLAGIGLLAVSTMASDCAVKSTEATPSVVVSAASARTVWDTIAVGEEISYPDFLVLTTRDERIDHLVNRWEVSDPAKLRLLTPSLREYQIDSPIRALALAPGNVQLAAVPTGVSFPNNQPVRFVANIVIRDDKPTRLDLPSTITLRVGDTVSYASNARSASGGTFSRGSSEWTSASVAVASVHRAESGKDYRSDAAERVRFTSFPADRIGIRGNAVGQTIVTVGYLGNGATLQHLITVNVVPNNARVEITRDQVFTTVANNALFVKARLLDAQGAAVDQRSIQYTSNIPAVATVVVNPACRQAQTTPACEAALVFNATEVEARGGVVKVSITASAPSAREDVIEVTVYNAVSRIAIEPANATMIVGSDRGYTVQYLDRRGVAIPRVAIRTEAVLDRRDASDAQYVQTQRTNGVLGASDSLTIAAVAVPSTGTATVPLRAGLALATATANGTPGAPEILTTETNLLLRAVNQVIVFPNPVTLNVGGSSKPVTVQLNDAASRAVTLALPVEWRSSNPAIFTVTPGQNREALVTPVSVGTADLIATVQGVEGRGQVIVGAAEAVRFTIVANPRGPTSDPSSALTPVAFNATRSYQLLEEGTPIANERVVWRSSNVAIADIATTGVTTCKSTAGGTATIFATFVGTGTQVTTTIVCAAGTSSRVAFIVLDPQSPEITAPATLQFTVRYLDALGNVTTPETTDGGTTVFSAAPGSATAVSGATINASTGLATALNAGGLSTIRAEYRKGGQLIAADETHLLVNPPTAGNYRSVVISTSGNVRSVKLGETVLFQVIILDANGNQVMSGVDPLNVGTSDVSALQVTRDTRFPSGYFYQVRGLKVSSPGTAADPLANVPVLAASVTGASTTLKFVVTP